MYPSEKKEWIQSAVLATRDVGQYIKEALWVSQRHGWPEGSSVQPQCSVECCMPILSDLGVWLSNILPVW